MVHQKLNQCSDSRTLVNELNIPQEAEDGLRMQETLHSGSVVNIKQELENNV